jgi:hypothetical protein
MKIRSKPAPVAADPSTTAQTPTRARRKSAATVTVGQTKPTSSIGKAIVAPQTFAAAAHGTQNPQLIGRATVSSQPLTEFAFGGQTYRLTTRPFGSGADLSWHGSVGLRATRDTSAINDPRAWTTLLEGGAVVFDQWIQTRAADVRLSAELYAPGVTTTGVDPGMLKAKLLLTATAPVTGETRPREVAIDAQIVTDDGNRGFGPYDNNFRVVVPIGGLFPMSPPRDAVPAGFTGYLAYSLDGGQTWARIGQDNRADGGASLKFERTY